MIIGICLFPIPTPTPCYFALPPPTIPLFPMTSSSLFPSLSPPTFSFPSPFPTAPFHFIPSLSYLISPSPLSPFPSTPLSLILIPSYLYHSSLLSPPASFSLLPPPSCLGRNFWPPCQQQMVPKRWITCSDETQLIRGAVGRSEVHGLSAGVGSHACFDSRDARYWITGLGRSHTKNGLMEC